MNTEMNDLGGSLTDMSAELRRIGELANGVGRALSTALRGAILDGKSLNSVLADVAKAFADIALKAALEPVGNLVSGVVQQLFKGTDSGLGKIPAFAKGGVISAPTFLGTGGQMALAGEAGPEAVLPLTRGADGRLGVAGGGNPTTINFAVTATDARSFGAAEAEISAMLLRAVKRGTRGS